MFLFYLHQTSLKSFEEKGSRSEKALLLADGFLRHAIHKRLVTCSNFLDLSICDFVRAGDRSSSRDNGIIL